MKKEFINIAAHELRTPILPILAISQILRPKISDDKEREYIDIIIRNTKRLQQLAENILDVTKIESQSLKLNKERFNINDVITNNIDDIILNIEFKNKKNSDDRGGNNNIKLIPPPPPPDCEEDPTAEGCEDLDPCIEDPDVEGCEPTPPPPIDPCEEDPTAERCTPPPEQEEEVEEDEDVEA